VIERACFFNHIVDVDAVLLTVNVYLSNFKYFNSTLLMYSSIIWDKVTIKLAVFDLIHRPKYRGVLVPHILKSAQLK
jgi:uncharacterized Fe-S radical SAM superfamily protein PflX